MKRQTKKGPRRSRAMPVSTKRFVVTDYRDTAYLTAGETYWAKRLTEGLLAIRDDDGDEIVIANPGAMFPCSHIGENRWRWATL